MDLGFAGKVVVVTGAKQGHWDSPAPRRSRAKGAKVALVSRSAANLDAALARLRARAHARARSSPTSCAPMTPLAWLDDVERSLGPVDVSRQLGRRCAPLRAGRSRCRRRGMRRWMRSISAYIHPIAAVAAAHGRPRPRQRRQHHRLAAARSRAPCICREAPPTPRSCCHRRPRCRVSRRRAFASTASIPDRRSPRA